MTVLYSGILAIPNLPKEICEAEIATHTDQSGSLVLIRDELKAPVNISPIPVFSKILILGILIEYLCLGVINNTLPLEEVNIILLILYLSNLVRDKSILLVPVINGSSSSPILIESIYWKI